MSTSKNPRDAAVAKRKRVTNDGTNWKNRIPRDNSWLNLPEPSTKRYRTRKKVISEKATRSGLRAVSLILRQLDPVDGEFGEVHHTEFCLVGDLDVGNGFRFHAEEFC